MCLAVRLVSGLLLVSLVLMGLVEWWHLVGWLGSLWEGEQVCCSCSEGYPVVVGGWSLGKGWA